MKTRLGAAALVLACAASMPAGATDVRVAIVTQELAPFCLNTGVVHDPDFSPYGLAGTGIALKGIQLSVPQAPVAVSQGDAEMGECAGFAVIAQAWKKGARNLAVVLVGGLKPIYVLVAGKKIKTLKDLKGGVIGSPGPQSTAEEAVELMLRRGAGLEPQRDYRLVSTGTGSARTAALMAGRIDAVPSYAPLSYRLADQGFNIVGDEMDTVPSYVAGLLYANRDWAEKNRATVVALLKTMVATGRWLVDPAKKDEVLARLAAHVTVAGKGMGMDYARRFYADIIGKGRVASEGYADEQAFRTILDIMASRGVLDKADYPPIGQVVDYSYLNEARRELGLPAVALEGH